MEFPNSNGTLECKLLSPLRTVAQGRYCMGTKAGGYILCVCVHMCVPVCLPVFISDFATSPNPEWGLMHPLMNAACCIKHYYLPQKQLSVKTQTL